MYKYDDYEYEDLSIEEQQLFLESQVDRGQIKSTDQRFRELNRRKAQYDVVLAKIKTTNDSNKLLEFGSELVTIDPFNKERILESAEISEAEADKNDSYGIFAASAARQYEALLVLDPAQVRLKVKIKKLRENYIRYHRSEIEKEGIYSKLVEEANREMAKFDRNPRFSVEARQMVIRNHIGMFMAASRRYSQAEDFERAVMCLKKVNQYPANVIRNMWCYDKEGRKQDQCYYCYWHFVAYSGMNDLQRAVPYISAHDWSGPAIFMSGSDAYYERGQLYSRNGEIELAIADFQKAIAVNRYADWLYWVALREERKKRNVLQRQIAAEVLRVAEIKAEQERQDKELLEQNLRKSREIEENALKAYQNAEYDQVIKLCNQAIVQCSSTQLAYLYLTLAWIRKDSRSDAIASLMNLSATGFDNPDVSLLLNVLSGQEAKAQKELRKHQKWLDQVDRQIVEKSIDGAINGLQSSQQLNLSTLPGISEQANMSPEKRIKLNKVILQQIKTHQVINDKFSKYREESLVYKISQALQPFFSSKIKWWKGSSPASVHFNIKDSEIENHARLKAALSQAIDQAMNLRIPNADTVLLLKARWTPINQELISAPIEAIHQRFIGESLWKSQQSKEKSPPLPPKSTKKTKDQPSVGRHTPKPKTEDPWDENSIFFKSSAETKSDIKAEDPWEQNGTFFKNLPETKSEIKTQAQLTLNFIEKLEKLGTCPRETLADLQVLNSKFKKLETEAMQLKNAQYYVSRGDFYQQSGVRDSVLSRQMILYANAMQDYQQAMSYDPFMIGLPERIQQLELQISKPRPPAAPQLQRANLTPEQILELERIKERMRLQKSNVQN